MAVSKRKRFEVFKRDGFACQYCGGKPPRVVLECDHMEPVSKGGSDDIDNLITSCFDCNRGKSNHDLEVAPASVSVKAEMLKEQREQLKAYQRLRDEIAAEVERDANDVGDYIDETLHDFFKRSVTEQFRIKSLRVFVRKGLSVAELFDAWDTAAARFNLHHPDQEKKPDPSDVIRYFCGICWKKIKEEVEL